MPPKRRIDSTIDSFFKRVDRGGDRQLEQDNSPAVVHEEAPNPEENRPAEPEVVQFTTSDIIDDFYAMKTCKVRLK
ncbi:hypothetical protein BDA96_01G355700 [Sorghum bicolor]|uniref:Uncharacterized protein n=2 Tax=Sorghum bicolor TaxID=4558 RepID=A0A921S348_SORBI|nr:hypothetical protein SORBI_3001G332100 [Sorghum bicolor]KAG0550641.1 hypothetical protein BDA96_01G355700 [Sorghum bicolor]